MRSIQRTIAIAALAVLAAQAGVGRAQAPAEPTHHHHDTGAATPPSTTAPPAKGAPTKSAPTKGLVTTIVGEVMDPACFLEAGAKSIGPGHYQCAIDCARSGQTLAIYDRANDRIYFIAGELPGQNPNDPVMAYIHKKVDVKGTVYHRADAWGIVIVRVTPHQEDAAAPASAPVPTQGSTK